MRLARRSSSARRADEDRRDITCRNAARRKGPILQPGHLRPARSLRQPVHNGHRMHLCRYWIPDSRTLAGQSEWSGVFTNQRQHFKVLSRRDASVKARKFAFWMVGPSRPSRIRRRDPGSRASAPASIGVDNFPVTVQCGVAGSRRGQSTFRRSLSCANKFS